MASADFHANGRSGPATPAPAGQPRKARALTKAHPSPDRAALRHTARQAREAFVAALAPAVRAGLEQALAERLVAELGALGIFGSSAAPGILGSYAAVGAELDPAAIEQAARARGWQTAFPRVTGAAPLAFHLAEWEDLRPGFKGIPEPDAAAPLVHPQLLLVPLLAADRAGNRLGQGAGHYDRTLEALRAHGPLFAVGLAFDVQLLERVPAAPWDQPLDAVATPTAFHRVAAGATGRA